MKINKKPLVSIIIPVYNGSNYLKKSIESAINQSYENIEIIVVNDGSNDAGKTLSIARNYKQIVLISKENGGVSSALNEGLKHAHGDYISWLSHDDEYKKDKIKHQIDFLNKQKQQNIIPYSKTQFIDCNDSIIKKLSIQAAMHKTISIKTNPFGFSINGCSLLIPRKAFKNGFNTDFRYIQDTIKWYELLKLGYIFKCNKNKDSLMRIHNETVTNKHPELYEFEFKKFYKNVRGDILKNKDLRAIKKSSKYLAIMSKKYPFYKELIIENIEILKQFSKKRMPLFFFSLHLNFFISKLLFR